MDYIQSLRKIIGHTPILMVGAAVLILDSQGRLLLMKRTDSGCWGPPGGAVEPGEVIEAAARREVREETSLQVSGLSLFGVFSGPELFYEYPNGDQVYNVTIVYVTQEWQGQVQADEEHSTWRWFSMDEIPVDLSPPIRPVIDRYVKLTGNG
ncbi:MAG: NUDIX domain-containing protein [Anaerolineales bacterium]|nr:NUDIX domain-containing protein [Anaerolineales bacterium]